MRHGLARTPCLRHCLGVSQELARVAVPSLGRQFPGIALLGPLDLILVASHVPTQQAPPQPSQM